MGALTVTLTGINLNRIPAIAAITARVHEANHPERALRVVPTGRKSWVRAPMTGRISRTLVSAGNLVTGGDSGGTLLTTIVTLDPIEIYFDIDEQSFLRYSNTASAHKRTFWNTLGAPVRVELQGDDSPIRTGTLDFLDNRLDPSTGTLRARARVQNPDLSLSPGEFGRVFIIGEPAHRALLVPDEAVTNDATRLVLKIIGSDDRVSLRPVTLGRKFGDLREISSGLGSEDRVIVSGLQGAQPGDLVIPQSRPLAGQHLATLGVER